MQAITEVKEFLNTEKDLSSMQEETLDQRFDSESASNITQQHRLESDASSFRATQNPSRNTQKSTDNSNKM